MASVSREVVKALVTSAGVQNALRVEAVKVAAAARAILAGHRASGRSYIKVTRGRVDWHVNLVDQHAREIEFVNRGQGAVAPLRRAVLAVYGNGANVPADFTKKPQGTSTERTRRLRAKRRGR